MGGQGEREGAGEDGCKGGWGGGWGWGDAKRNVKASFESRGLSVEKLGESENQRGK